MEVAPQFICCIGKTHEEAVKKFEASQMYEHLISLKASTLKDQAGMDMVATNLVGTAAEVVEKAHKLSAVGVTHLCGTYYVANTPEELKEQMEIFAEEVMPHI